MVTPHQVMVELLIRRASQPRTYWRLRRAASKEIFSPFHAVAAAQPELPRCQLSHERRWLVVRHFVSDAEREALLKLFSPCFKSVYDNT